jgi:phosphate/sulfate permease
MNDHSKLIGYFTLSILIVSFVAWAKYSFLSQSVFVAILIATGAFFIGWRVFTGIWPGNDAPR